MKTSTARQQPDGSIQFSYWEYELLNFQLTDRYVAVCTTEDGIKPYPLDAIGLAKVSTHYRQRSKGSVTTTQTREPTTENKLVGLRLDDYGQWCIANDYAGYLGMAHATASKDELWQMFKHHLQAQQDQEDERW